MKRIVLKRESNSERGRWMQYILIEDQAVTCYEFVPALLDGWNLHGIWRSGPDDWDGMNAERIAAWKLASAAQDGCDRELVPGEADRFLANLPSVIERFNARKAES